MAMVLRAVDRCREELRDDCTLDHFAFVLATMIQGLTSAALLSRPPGMGLAQTRDEVLTAIDAYVWRYRRSPG